MEKDVEEEFFTTKAHEGRREIRIRYTVRVGS
jgi:hypothetical protein